MPLGPQKFSLETLSGLQFEHWSAKLMSKLGFDRVHTTQASQDYGIDVIGKLNYGQSFGIQCKHLRDHDGSIGYSAVEQTEAGIKFYRLSCGIVLTNGHFTLHAQRGARKAGIILWGNTDLMLLRRMANAHITIYDLLDYEKKIIPLVKVLMPRHRHRND